MAASFPAGDLGNDAVVVSCGDCCVSGGASGLTCRINQRVEVPGAWDEERRAVCCAVPKQEFCVPDLSYEVVDAFGNVVCKSTGCCKATPNAACAVSCKKVCDQPFAVDGSDTHCNDKCSAGAGMASLDGRAASGTRAGAKSSVFAGLSWLDRLLPVWIIGSMVLGVLLGYFVPKVRTGLAVLEIGGVSLPIALGLWVMMWPVLTKVQYELLAELLGNRAVAKQFAVSFVLNWLLGPALMTGLAWACLPDLPNYRNGVIMVGLARCIAMVLIWNQLARGHQELCAVMVAFNSVLQIVLYAPLSLFYLQVVSGTSGVHVGFWPVAKSVLLFLGVPLVAGIVLRYGLLLLTSKAWFEKRFMPYFGPWALIGLLYTIVVMFAAQGDKIINEIGNVVRVAVPMLIYFILMFFLSLLVSWWCRMSYEFSVTQAFTASSNNFELAIAVAVGTFGIQSREALAATVGPLIEVPALLALVYVALWIKGRVWDKAEFGHADAAAKQELAASDDAAEVVRN